ncbi:MAG: hypothetical protein M3M95_06355, partial [Pseudomonadota bacterium]|nr:hypothetical protein [Pseudomonadota bacterium]
MRVAVLLALLPILLTAAAADAGTQIVRFEEVDGSTVSGTLERPRRKSPVPLLLVLRDRPCGAHGRSAPAPRVNAPPGAARLELAPPQTARGTPPCGPAAHQARVLEVVTAVTRLREDAPWWNRRLYLVGASEGARVAASAAELLPEAGGVVLIDPPQGAGASLGAERRAPVLLLQG